MGSEPHWRWHWSEMEVELAIDSEVYSYLREQTQHDGQPERGGQIFMDINDPEGLNIIAATPPSLADKSGPTWLELDEARCKKEIIDFNAKGYRLIGYWHTHPQDIPEISSQDITSFRNFSKRNKANLPNPIAIIIGRSHSIDGIKAWSFQNLTPVLAEIKLG